MKKKIGLIAMLFGITIAFSCNSIGQKDNKLKHTSMERFNIEKYEKNIESNPSYEGYQVNDSVFIKQYHIIKEGIVEDKYNRNIVINYIEEAKANNGFKTVKVFNKGGEIILIKHFFKDNVEIGLWQWVQSGEIIREENKDKGYLFGINDVLMYGKQNNVDFSTTGKIEKGHTGNTPMWKLEWNTQKLGVSEGQMVFKNVSINASNGKIITSKEYSVNPIRQY